MAATSLCVADRDGGAAEGRHSAVLLVPAQGEGAPTAAVPLLRGRDELAGLVIAETEAEDEVESTAGVSDSRSRAWRAAEVRLGSGARLLCAGAAQGAAISEAPAVALAVARPPPCDVGGDGDGEGEMKRTLRPLLLPLEFARLLVIALDRGVMAKSDAEFFAVRRSSDHLCAVIYLFCFHARFFPTGLTNFGIDARIGINAHRNGIKW